MNQRSEPFLRVVKWVLLALVLLNALVAGLRTVSDPDMGWHLATGRYVVEHRQIPSVDVLSYTSRGKPWIYPPFAQVLLYLIFRCFGYAGLSWSCAIVSAATLAYLVRRRGAAVLILALCAVTPIAFRMLPRADLFTAPFFALFLGELLASYSGTQARLWVLPPVMLLWVNLHPGFIAGLAIVLAYLLIEAAELLVSGRRAAAVARLGRTWPWLAATGAVTLLNPWGPKLYGASLALAGLRGSAPGTFSTSSYIGEFLSVPISSHLLVQLIDVRHPENGYAWLMLTALAVVAVALWQKRVGIALVQAAALYASIQHARYISLFCITTVVLGASLAEDGKAPEPGAEGPGPRGRLRIPFGFGAALLMLASLVAILRIADFVSNRTYVVFQANSRFGAGESSWFPERAAEFIQRERLPGNIFEEFAVGGFAAWRLGPGYPDFIDGRADHLDPALLVSEHELLSHGPDAEVWREAADRWGINVLLISEGGSRSMDRQDALAFCRSSLWRPIYMDEVSLVLLRDVAGNRAWLDRLQIDCRSQPLVPPASGKRKDRYDFELHAGGLYFALQRDREAENALLQAAALYPEDPIAPLWLAQLYQRERRFDQAEAAYRASLERNESDKTWYELGRFYALTGRLPEAANAFDHAARLSVAPFIPYIALGQMEVALQRPQRALRDFDAAEASSPYRQGTQALASPLYAQIAAGRAQANRLLGRLPEAIRFQREAVRLDPNARHWNQLADLLAAAGQTEEAAQARQRAQELSAQTPR